MIFAAMTDMGLIPFLIFSALMAHDDYTGNAYGWGTLFPTSDASYKVIYAFYLISVVQGCLTLISLALGIYLAIVFRKIAKLPLDMNPLEPNLTARPHKRNKSELTDKYTNSATASLINGRMSKASDPFTPASRRVPFMHTRTDSADSLEGYLRSSARHSGFDSLLPSRDNSPTRPQPTVSPAENARQAGMGLYQAESRFKASPIPSESRHSWLSFSNYEGVPTLLSDEAERQLDRRVRPLSPVSPVSSRSHSRDNNHTTSSWQRLYRDTPEYDPFSSEHSPERPSAQHLETRGSQQFLQPRSLESSPQKRSRDPLGMNPPSPYQNQYYSANEGQQRGTSSAQLGRNAQQNTDGNATTRTSSFVGSGGKTRFYGSLRSSVGSIIIKDERKMSGKESDSSDYERTRTLESEDSNVEIHGVDDDSLDENGYPQIKEASSDDDDAWRPSGRNVSTSTGFDLRGGYAGLTADFGKGMARRREVSGKVAEEGRSPDSNFRAEEVNSGVVEKQKAGAAGWSRFKGL